MSSFISQHQSDPYSRFTTGVTSELAVREDGSSAQGDSEMLKTMKALLSSFALTNKLLSASYGAGVADRRSGQTYYIDVGVKIPEFEGLAPASADVRVLVNTTRISELVSPSLGHVDVKFNIGVDSFSIHRYKTPTPANKIFPISVVCDKLQSSSNARYLTVLSGESGTALSGTAQSVFFGEIPSSLEFRIGFMDVSPNDPDGTLNRKVWPLVFTETWKDTAEGKLAPRIPDTDELLWASSEIYAMSMRLYVIPTITPRVHVESQ